MINRLCPTEEDLSMYLYGKLSKENSRQIEEHIVDCDDCRNLLGEAYDVIKQNAVFVLVNGSVKLLKNNINIAISILFFGLSFVFSVYFYQFLILSFLSGVKWIVDKTTGKTFVMINKRSDKQAGKNIVD